MPPARQKRRPRRVPERSLWAALAWSLLAVLGLSLATFEAELHWPNSPLNNLWSLLIVNGQVSPSNPLIGQLVSQINHQDLIFFSFASLLGGGITLGRLAPRAATRRRVLGAAAGATGTVVVVCLALAWSLQLWMQRGRLMPHQIDAVLVAAQLGWAVSWVLVYMAGARLGMWWRDRHAPVRHAQEMPDTARTANLHP